MDRPLTRGKVRDVIDLGTSLLLITTDRISAFDRPLGELPGKGELLNQHSLHWFDRTRDLVPGHVLEVLGPRSVRVKKAAMVPVEVVVRGYLAGSALRAQRTGRPVPGLTVPAGLRPFEAFPQPCLTPSTKEAVGEHDLPLSGAEVVARGLCPPRLWEQIEATALALFRRGQADLAPRGLLLVDTKYEFGLVDGQLTLCDEVHTPDCSRFWYAGDYEAALREGREPRQLDKEYLRSWLLAQGFDGEGPVPDLPAAVLKTTLDRYVECFETSTGRRFVPSGRSVEAETLQILSALPS